MYSHKAQSVNISLAFENQKRQLFLGVDLTYNKMNYGGKPPMSKSGLICLNIGLNGNKLYGSIMTETT
jgi:hypothetical protein